MAAKRKAPSIAAPTELELLRAELERLSAERDEARADRDESEAQKAALAEVLSIINSSPGDPVPVFDAILDKAHSLCGATRGTLFLFDGDTFRAAAAHGYSDAFVKLRRRGISVSENSVFNPLLAGAPLIHHPDLTQLDNAISRATAEQGVRTELLLPLRKDGVLLGVISCNRTEVRPFTDKQIALLQNFAAQAVIAMENARLLTETREALEQQTATAEVLQVISRSTFDLQSVLDTLLATAARICDADVAIITVQDGEAYRCLATFAASPEYEAVSRGRLLPKDRSSVTGRVALKGGIVHIHDLISEPEYGTPDTIVLGNIRTALGVPLTREGIVVGTINLGRTRVQPYIERQIDLVRTFADQAVIAMENARLLGELRQRTEEVAELNRSLEARVAEQVEELGRVGRLKRFLAPQLAQMIVSQGEEKILESHRREIVVVFCDLRGYTAFTETAEPEEVLDFLREYHGALGPLVSQFQGTLDQFSGDGIMVFFNDPMPTPNPAERAVKMAVAMREAAGSLIEDWRERGRELGFGVGIAQGYATLGQIGFPERYGYTAIGTVCNVAARLCAEAKDGQILLSQRVNVGLKGSAATEQVGPLTLKGLSQPVVAYNVLTSANQPTLRVIEGGPPND